MKRRCPAVEECIDGAESGRCMRERGHAPPHHCPHGFHWVDAPPAEFRGKCDYCGAAVTLKPPCN